MNNAKQQAIINAYGEYFERCNPDENGWTKYMYDENGLTLSGFEPLGEYQTKNHFIGVYEWRPEQLSGIENNNGWIRIESEEQYDELPNGYYEWYNINTGRQVKSDLWQYGTFIHYKPIISSPPPIY